MTTELKELLQNQKFGILTQSEYIRPFPAYPFHYQLCESHHTNRHIADPIQQLQCGDECIQFQCSPEHPKLNGVSVA